MIASVLPSITCLLETEQICLIPAECKHPEWSVAAGGDVNGVAAVISSPPAEAAGEPCSAVGGAGWSHGTVRFLVHSLVAWFL